MEPHKSSHAAPSSKPGGPSEGSSLKRVMFSGVSDGESPSESQDDVWVLREDDKNLNDDQIDSIAEDPVPVTGIVIARPQLVCRPVVVPNPQYVLARVDTHPTPSLVPNSIHSVTSPMSGAAKPIATNSPRKIISSNPINLAGTFPRACAVPAVRPPPPPPPPRTTPIATGSGPMRPVNPALQRPNLQQRGNFHESPDEGYHEDDAGSEAL